MYHWIKEYTPGPGAFIDTPNEDVALAELEELGGENPAKVYVLYAAPNDHESDARYIMLDGVLYRLGAAEEASDD